MTCKTGRALRHEGGRLRVGQDRVGQGGAAEKVYESYMETQGRAGQGRLA